MGEFGKSVEMRYQRSYDHNYLVIRKPKGAQDDYQLNMILENRIPCLLPAESRECEGEEELYYEISSLQPISRLYGHKELRWDEVRFITEGILDAYEKLQDYLLDDGHIVLEAEQIYLDLDEHKLYLLFFPYYECPRERSFLQLAEYFLDRIDHRDTTAAMFGYKFYKVVRRDNFVPEDIRRAISELPILKGEKETSYEDTVRIPAEEIADRRSDYGSTKKRDALERDYPLTEKETKKGAMQDTGFDPAAEELCPCDNDDAEKAEKRRLPVLAVILLVLGFIVASGVIPGMRSGSTRPLTAALLIIIGAVLLILFLLGKKKPPRSPEPEDIFADLEPSFAETQTEEEAVFRRQTAGEEYRNPVREVFPAEDEEENYGKTVFIEPEKEELRYVLKEKGRAKEHPMREFPYTIGKVRDCVDLALPDSSVSRIHARILKSGDNLCLQDCRSTNGTYLNGMRLEAEEQVMLEKGDEVGIGKLRFELA